MKSIRRVGNGFWGPALLAVAIAVAGCAQQGAEGEDASSHGEVEASSEVLEPRHGGRLVDLDGSHTAELVVVESGMTWVYLYDENNEPVPFEGKEVMVTFTTLDGETYELPMEGMGTGAQAHFMNPIDEAMLAHIKEQGAYTATIAATIEGQTETGTIEIELGG